MARRSTPRLLAALVAVAAVVCVPATASAHTDFDYSVPTEGASVGDVLDEITVAFTEVVTLVGPGFEVLDPQGRVLTPFPVTDDDLVFRLQLDPPIGGGLTAVKYTVAAADGHLLEGNFTFTVAAPEPVTPPTTPPITEPAEDDVPTTEPPVGTDPVEPAVVTSVAPDTAVPTASTAPAATADSTDANSAGVDAGMETATEDAGVAADDDDGDDDGGSSTTYLLLGLGAVVAAGFAFLLVRARASS